VILNTQFRQQKYTKKEEGKINSACNKIIKSCTLRAHFGSMIKIVFCYNYNFKNILFQHTSWVSLKSLFYNLDLKK
jgi:hypothetical protein